MSSLQMRIMPGHLGSQTALRAWTFIGLATPCSRSGTTVRLGSSSSTISWGRYAFNISGGSRIRSGLTRAAPCVLRKGLVE